MRMLVPIRLSRFTNASNNPASQRKAADRYARQHPGTTLIFTEVEDLDVSGNRPIRERPGIGMYLTSEKITTFDGILAPLSMDRLSRNMLDYLMFARDMMAIGKIIIDLSDGTDTSTRRGQRELEKRVHDAQTERDKDVERAILSVKEIADDGRYPGGYVRYGYMGICQCHELRHCPDPERRPGCNYTQDPETRPIVLRMIDDAFAGHSYTDIKHWLRDENVPTSQGKLGFEWVDGKRKRIGHSQWWETAVKWILTSPTLYGAESVKGAGGQPVERRNEDGEAIFFTDQPLITKDRFDELQLILTKRRRSRGASQARHLLYRVGFERQCSRACDDEAPCLDHLVPLKGMRQHSKNLSHSGYYVCKQYSKCHQQVRIDDLEQELTDTLLETAGDSLLQEWVLVRGKHHSKEIIALQRRNERLRRILDEEEDEDIERSVARNEDKIAKLIAESNAEPDRKELRCVEPHTTIRAFWESLDLQGRNKFLRDWGIVIMADREGSDVSLGWLPIDEPLTIDSAASYMERAS